MAKREPERFETGRPMLLAGLRQYHPYAQMVAGIAAQWERFNALGELPGRIGRLAYGAICGNDGNGFEYLAGVEVSSFDQLPADMGRMRVPAQTYAVFTHKGPVTTLHATWESIFEWLQDSDFDSAHAPDFERYDPEFDPLTGKGGIEVWIGVVPKPTDRKNRNEKEPL